MNGRGMETTIVRHCISCVPSAAPATYAARITGASMRLSSGSSDAGLSAAAVAARAFIASPNRRKIF